MSFTRIEPGRADVTSGDLVFLHGLGRNILILNSHEVITDLLEKQGANYSARPHLIMANELMGLGKVRRIQNCRLKLV